MKKHILIILSFLLFALTIQAQAPGAFKYQTVLRGANGEVLADQNVTIGIDLLQNDSPIYSEDHSATTNSFGLISLDIGRGTVVGGDFNTVDWNIPTSIRILLDETGGGSLQVIGTSELLSVPYALYAANGGGGDSIWSEDGDNINSDNSGNVGIGTNAPDRKLEVETSAADDGVMTVNNTDAAGFAGTYYESEGNIKGYVGYVGSGNWIEPNSYQLGSFNEDIKFLTTNAFPTAPMTIRNANQSVGIGTNAPDRKLEVETSAADDGVMTVNNTDAAGFAGTYYESESNIKGYVGYVGSGNWVEPNSYQVGSFNEDIKFLTTNAFPTAPMTIRNTNQSVGIGTNAPDRKLEVETSAADDGVMTVNNTDAAGFAGTYYESEGNIKGYVGYVGSGNWVEPNSYQVGSFNEDIKFLTTNAFPTAPMTIRNTNQSVGIGTNAPDRKLEVETSAADDGVMTVNNTDAAGFAGTYYESEGNIKGYVGYVGSGNWVEPNSYQVGAFNEDIKFLTTNAFLTAPMTIRNDNQSVGIGTNTPSRKLEVETSAAADGVMTVNNTNAAGFAGTYYESEGNIKGYVGYVGSGNWVEPNSYQVGAFNEDIKFLTTNAFLTAPMTIRNSNQSVGIGTNTPDYKLAVHHGGTGVQIKNVSAGAASWELYHSSSTNQLLLRNANNVSVGHFDYDSGAYMATSDRKLKRNIQPIASILPSVMKLMPVNYHYETDNDEKTHLGFIAQDVEEVFPELVSSPEENDSENAIYRMNYTGFGVLAIKAIQEQQQVIKQQQEIIEKQQSRLDAIEKALEKAGISIE